MYEPLVGRWCRLAGLQAADADDVAQDVFRAVAGKVPDFRRVEGGTFRGWLRTITRNKILDWKRRQGKEQQARGGSEAQAQLKGVEADPPPESSADQERDERAVLLRRAIDLVLEEFAETTRAAFLKVVRDGQDPAAVAAELGVSLNTVYLAKSRVMRRLRAEFDGMLDH